MSDETAHEWEATWKSSRHTREAFLDLAAQPSHNLNAAKEGPLPSHMKQKTYPANPILTADPENHEK